MRWVRLFRCGFGFIVRCCFVLGVLDFVDSLFILDGFACVGFLFCDLVGLFGCWLYGY